MKNICIKCGVDLYAAEGRFECQKHPKECKGIILPKETLQEWADKEKQKQHLIDMMKADEELGLYEEPKQTDEKGKPMTYWGGLEKPKQETLEEAAERYRYGNTYDNFIRGAKWQQERSYSEEKVLELLKKFYQDDNNFNGTIEEWFEQFKKK